MPDYPGWWYAISNREKWQSGVMYTVIQCIDANGRVEFRQRVGSSETRIEQGACLWFGPFVMKQPTEEEVAAA
jgi:hypothetical protein